ncbi:protein-disulfide reductase DsbD family protein [Schleiferiaceae bacterium]|nr:protein-disulfide reductase DsbD family protein [Schleiferiaceae bacterium]
MKRILALFAVIVSTVLYALPQPVKWSTSNTIIEDKVNVVIHAEIAPGWHLYSQNLADGGPIPTSFYLDSSSAFAPLGKWTEGEPHVEFDPNFDMDLAFFSESADFSILLEPLQSDFIVKGELEFMVCNDEMCLPPTYVDFRTEVLDAPLPSVWEGLGTTFWLGFLGGFAALIMPCIFPMIPLTVSFFTKQSKTKAEGVFKASLYGLGIIVIYVALGLAVSVIFGSDALNQMATNPWFNLAFFALFVIFAASFFGAFEITLPSSWVNKADDASNKGGMLGIFFMAFTLSLVSFSCTGPIIGTLLVEAGQKGSLLGPAVGMFGFSLALAIPFTLFAAFPGWLNSLPSSGGWLNTVKVTLGFLELAFALKFLSTADLVWQAHWLERELFLAIWVAIAFMTAFYLLGAFRMPLDSPVTTISVPRLSFAMVFMILGFYMLPGIFGAPVKLISGFPPPEHYAETKSGAYAQPVINMVGTGESAAVEVEHGDHCPNGLPCFNDFDAGLAYAKEVGKPILIDFTGWGCQNCRKMEENVWVDERVHKRLRDKVVLISLYVDERTKFPKEEQYISEVTGRKIKNVGNKWSEFEEVNFGAVSQPLYVFLGHDDLKPLIETRGADLDIEAYIDWLDRGVAAFK